MKLLFDANISFRIVKKLQFAFPDCLHVSRTGLSYPAKDPEIWKFARQNNCVVVTYDEDFYDFLSLYGGIIGFMVQRTFTKSSRFRKCWKSTLYVFYF